MVNCSIRQYWHVRVIHSSTYIRHRALETSALCIMHMPRYHGTHNLRTVRSNPGVYEYIRVYTQIRIMCIVCARVCERELRSSTWRNNRSIIWSHQYTNTRKIHTCSHMEMIMCAVRPTYSICIIYDATATAHQAPPPPQVFQFSSVHSAIQLAP